MLTAVPARTNEKQAVIFFVRRHLAPPGSVVTESKLLTDAVTGTKREVDVVVEQVLATGETMVISVEVAARSRPAGLPYVEQLICKHRRLPTTNLVIVCWQGFTSSAIKAVHAEGGRVRAVTPTMEPNGLAPEITIEQTTVRARDATVTVQLPDGSAETIAETPLNVDLYDDENQVICPLIDVAMNRANDDNFRYAVSQEADKAPDVSALTHLSHGQPLPSEPHFYLLNGVTLGFLRLLELEFWYELSIERVPLTFEVMRLDAVLFGHCRATLGGVDTVFVATNGTPPGTVSVSFRPTDAKPNTPASRQRD